MIKNEYLLLASQQQQVVETLHNVGLATGEFLWEQRTSRHNRSAGEISVFIHRSTAFEISFDRSSYGYWRVDFTPGNEAINESQDLNTREEALAVADQWAEYLAREIKSQDFLAVALQAQPLLPMGLLPEDSLESFSEDERDEVLEKLNNIEAHILSLAENLDQHRDFVSQQFKTLRSDTLVISKSGFRNLLFSSLLGIGMTVLGTEGTREIMLYAASQLENILNTGQQLLSD